MNQSYLCEVDDVAVEPLSLVFLLETTYTGVFSKTVTNAVLYVSITIAYSIASFVYSRVCMCLPFYRPVSAAALAILLRKGEVDGMTMTWTTGMPEWKPLGEVGGVHTNRVVLFRVHQLAQ